MIARPALTVLGCRSCQNAIFRAVAAATPTIRHLPPYPLTRHQFPSRRLFATDPFQSDSKPQDEIPQSNVDSTEETPWFLEEEVLQQPTSQHHVTLPKTPEGAPALVEPLIKYVYEDMGLDDLSLLDLRDLDPPASLGPNLIMMLGTARSERHLHIASGRLARWIRKNYGIHARADGLIGPGELKTKLRRLRKKAKMMGNNTAMIPDGDNGISTGWVCVNFDVVREAAAESASFDESGKVSGFGGSRDATTIVIQCLTESRREELNLESLWKGILGRSLKQRSRIRGEPVAGEAELDKLLEAKLQLHSDPSHSNPSELQWKALRQASQQQRYYSTTIERPPRPETSAASPSINFGVADSDANQGSASTSKFNGIRREMMQIIYAGTPLSQERLLELVAGILLSDTSAVATGAERLAMVDQLLLTAQERGLKLWSSEMLVTLLESVITSPSYDADLLRAQKNLELLITEKQTPPEPEHTCRLMTAYAHRKDWDSVWDAFRVPARFNKLRAPELYETAYQLAAESGDATVCKDMLRWVYPEMATEQKAVLQTEKVYQDLKACILLADPAAEELLRNPPPVDNLNNIERRRLQEREFLKVLRDVEALRDFMSKSQAQNLV